MLIFIKSFCGFTSRNGVFARGARLNCEVLTAQDGAATQLLSFTKVMTNDFHPSQLLCPGHAKVTENY